MPHRPPLIVAALAAAAAACSIPSGAGAQPAAAAHPHAAQLTPTAPTPAAHAFRIGRLQAWALVDGAASFPNDNKVLGVGRTPADVAALLSAAGLPGDQIRLNIDPLLVRTGDRYVLFDAGASGSVFGENAGRLVQSLAAAGLRPEQITDVAISHSHPDHVAGLVDGGKLTFPNARIHLSAAEWAAMQANPRQAELVKAISPKVAAFQWGAEIAPGVFALDTSGHTPGHTSYEVRSGEARLLYVGDTMHHHVVSVQRPDWPIAFDASPRGLEQRKAILARAADEKLTVYAVHFPYPSLGHIRRQGDSFVWVPMAADHAH
jgi:glyoxylase-like metal-dependent hydrolase (beta-lactamase superfamily II)